MRLLCISLLEPTASGHLVEILCPRLGLVNITRQWLSLKGNSFNIKFLDRRRNLFTFWCFQSHNGRSVSGAGARHYSSDLLNCHHQPAVNYYANSIYLSRDVPLFLRSVHIKAVYSNGEVESWKRFINSCSLILKQCQLFFIRLILWSLCSNPNQNSIYMITNSLCFHKWINRHYRS